MLNIRPFLFATLLGAATCFVSSAQTANNDEVNKLVAVLKSDAPQKEKADACRELARIGNKDAVAPLAALLPDEKLSHMARYGLETIPDPAVDDVLREAAEKLQGRQLVGVIGSIGVRRDTQAVKILAGRLHSPDNDVAQAAARSLGSIGNSAAAQALQHALPDVSAANQLAFCEGLLRCAEAATVKGDCQAAQNMYNLLREVPAPHQVRTAALRGALLTRTEGRLSLLSKALRNDDFVMVLAAVRTTQELPGPEVTRLLASELPGLSTDRQILVIQTLAKRSDTIPALGVKRADSAALLALFNAAQSGEQPVRVAAIRALAEMGDNLAIPVLVELLGDADKETAAAAQESLASLSGQEVDAAIMKLLADSAANHRITAMELIVRRRMTTAIPALFDAAGNSDSKVRTAAVRKLGELAGPAELPAMLDLLAGAKNAEDLETTEQALSAIILQSTTPAACVGKVEARLSQAKPDQKCALLRLLGGIGGADALKAIRAAVGDSDTEVHGVAIRTLSGWTSVDAAPDLLELAKTAGNATDKMLCLRGYLALASHGDLPIDQRLTMCRQATPLVQKDDEKKLLLAALGGIVSAEAIELIKPYLEDAATKEEASTGTVNISDRLLQGGDAAKVASKLIEPLEKAAQATASTDLAKRANDLRDKAKTKADAK